MLERKKNILERILENLSLQLKKNMQEDSVC